MGENFLIERESGRGLSELKRILSVPVLLGGVVFQTLTDTGHHLSIQCMSEESV